MSGVKNQKKGSLVLVGSGIKLLSHVTHEALVHIENADIVCYLSNDDFLSEWVVSKAKKSESLAAFYYKHEKRIDSYNAISNHVVSLVERGLNVCFLIYGHPSVFSYPGLASVKMLKKRGGVARVLPAISAEDCLFADLLVDPGSIGCLSYEASDLVVYDRVLIPSSHLIIWQISTVGEYTHYKGSQRSRNIKCLVDKLLKVYPRDHAVIVYVAARYPGFEPVINRVLLKNLFEIEISRFSTLYVPPALQLSIDKNILECMSDTSTN
jgi:tetrapyrrole methylase family protein / MazG family protein